MKKSLQLECFPFPEEEGQPAGNSPLPKSVPKRDGHQMAMSRPGHYCGGGGGGGRCWRRKTVERERRKPSWETSLHAEPALQWPALVGQRDKDSLQFVQVGLGGRAENREESHLWRTGIHSRWGDRCTWPRSDTECWNSRQYQSGRPAR